MIFLLQNEGRDMNQCGQYVYYTQRTLWIVAMRANVCMVAYVKLIRIWNLKAYRPTKPPWDMWLALYQFFCPKHVYFTTFLLKYDLDNTAICKLSLYIYKTSLTMAGNDDFYTNIMHKIGKNASEPQFSSVFFILFIEF